MTIERHFAYLWQLGQFNSCVNSCTCTQGKGDGCDFLNVSWELINPS